MMSKSNKEQSYSPNMHIIVHYSFTKWSTQGLWGCLFFFYIFYIYILYFVSQVLCICTDDPGWFCMRNVFFIYCNDFWWGVGIASELKLEVLKNDTFCDHNCFYYLLFFCLIILFYFCSNIPYNRGWLRFICMGGWRP
jgi:hypothetical protein